MKDWDYQVKCIRGKQVHAGIIQFHLSVPLILEFALDLLSRSDFKIGLVKRVAETINWSLTNSANASSRVIAIARDGHCLRFPCLPVDGHDEKDLIAPNSRMY